MGQIKNSKLLKQIAVKLKELRVAQKLTQEALYNDTNIHVGRIETGRVNISVSTLCELCNYFGITLTQFFQTVENEKKA